MSAAPWACWRRSIPADGMIKRIARIYTGADPLDSLDGKVKTGSRLNLARSLTQNLLLTLAVFRQQSTSGC